MSEFRRIAEIVADAEVSFEKKALECLLALDALSGDDLALWADSLLATRGEREAVSA